MQSDYAQLYQQLYFHHWWWRARESIILSELNRLSLKSPVKVLDVGCGNGLFLPALAKWSGGEVYGIETDTSLLTEDCPYRRNIYTDPFGEGRYDRMRGHFDLVTALDVIEHVEDDASFVTHMIDLLKPGGCLLVTVPAFQSLWDYHDDINQHYRRYTSLSLSRVLASQGEVFRIRYLFPSLFAAKWLVARVNRHRRNRISQASVPASLVTAVVTTWLRIEDPLTRLLKVPFGTSVLAMTRKADG